MLAVQLAAQEDEREEGCKEHLRPAHHLVHAGSDAEQPHIHEHRGHQVKDGGYAQQRKLPELCNRLHRLLNLPVRTRLSSMRAAEWT